MKNISPIILFTHTRLNLLKKCIKSLKKNKLAQESTLYIFSDGPINKKQNKKIAKVRFYLKRIDGFKKVKIFFKKKNYGLSKNIINGVTKILKKEKKAIIIEDDLIFDKFFLEFMNSSLNKYENKKKVWHISGWNYNIDLKLKEDTFFTRGMNCWGWATWRDRWKYFEKNPKTIINTWDKNKINKFNFDNSINFFSQILKNNKKVLNTWAVFWYATIYENKKLCLNPKKTFTENIGESPSATNTKSIDKIFSTNLIQRSKNDIIFPNEYKENLYVLKLIKNKIKSNKVKQYIKKIVKKPIKFFKAYLKKN